MNSRDYQLKTPCAQKMQELAQNDPNFKQQLIISMKPIFFWMELSIIHNKLLLFENEIKIIGGELKIKFNPSVSCAHQKNS